MADAILVSPETQTLGTDHVAGQCLFCQVRLDGGARRHDSGGTDRGADRDTRGKQVSSSLYRGHKSQIFQYRTCRKDSLVQVSFSKTPGTRYRMDGKYSIWG